MINGSRKRATLYYIKKYKINTPPSEEFEYLFQIERECVGVPNTTPDLNIMYSMVKELTDIYNISAIEAIIKYKNACESVPNIKRPHASTIFIRDLFGEESERYKNKLEDNKKCVSCSFENFSKSYDDKELAKMDFNKKYGSNNIEHLKEKFGVTEEEAKKIINERTTKARETFEKRPEDEKLKVYKTKGLTIENYINKYGEEVGREFYERDKQKRLGRCTLKYYIEKYGEEAGKEKYESVANSKNYLDVEFWLKRGFTEMEATEKIKDILSNRSNFSLKYAIEKHGEEEGRKIWQRRQDEWQKTLKRKSKEELDRINKSKGLSREQFIAKYGEERWNHNKIKRLTRCSASKVSIKFFIPLYKELRRLGIVERKDVFWRIGDSKEYFLRTKEKIYFYDFTIKNLNIILEFNGVAWHPREGDYEWVNPFGVDYETAFNNDKHKRELAIERGFDIFYIWEDEEDFYIVRENLLKTIIDIFEIKNLKKK